MNDKMVDITGAECVEIDIRHDGKVIWINKDGMCVLRICQIENLEIVDDRKLKGLIRHHIYKDLWICQTGNKFRVKKKANDDCALHHGSFDSYKRAVEFIDNIEIKENFNEQARK